MGTYLRTETQAAEFIIERMRQLPRMRYHDIMGSLGFSEAKALLESDAMERARGYAGRIVAVTGGKARYWRVKTLRKGMTHPRTRESKYLTTSLLECFNSEIRAREWMGTAWTVHNLPVMLQLRGVPT